MAITRSGRNTVNANSSGSSKATSKQMKNDRRRNEALIELSSLVTSASTIVQNGVKRRRIQAQHPDAAYYNSVNANPRAIQRHGEMDYYLI
jgi:hypothetical protein